MVQSLVLITLTTSTIPFSRNNLSDGIEFSVCWLYILSFSRHMYLVSFALELRSRTTILRTICLLNSNYACIHITFKLAVNHLVHYQLKVQLNTWLLWSQLNSLPTSLLWLSPPMPSMILFYIHHVLHYHYYHSSWLPALKADQLVCQISWTTDNFQSCCMSDHFSEIYPFKFDLEFIV